MIVDEDGVIHRGVFLRSPYNYDMNAASDASGLFCEDESRAIQSAKEECDINTIVERFGLTGQLPTDVPTPIQGDFTTVVDYQSALNMVIAADDAFMEMPASVRSRFGNNPQKFLDFASDDKNRDEARKLGLLLPEVAKPGPLEVRVIPDAPK